MPDFSITPDTDENGFPVYRYRGKDYYHRDAAREARIEDMGGRR